MNPCTGRHSALCSVVVPYLKYVITTSTVRGNRMLLFPFLKAEFIAMFVPYNTWDKLSSKLPTCCTHTFGLPLNQQPTISDTCLHHPHAQCAYTQAHGAAQGMHTPSNTFNLHIKGSAADVQSGREELAVLDKV